MQGGNQRLILSIMSQLHRSLPTFFVSFSQSYHKIEKKERENCKKFCCKIINNFSIIIHFPVQPYICYPPAGPRLLFLPGPPPLCRRTYSLKTAHLWTGTAVLWSKNIFPIQRTKERGPVFAGAALLLFILSNFLFCVAGSSFIFSPILLAGSPPEPGPRPPGPAA